MLKPSAIAVTLHILSTIPDPAAIAQNNLQVILLWTATIVLVSTAGLLVAGLLGLVKRTREDPVNKSSSVLDAIWTVIPVVLLIILILLTFQAVFWREM